MTPETKIIETLFVTIATVVIVLTNKKMFFEKDHIGNLLAETSRPMTKLRDKSVQTE